MKHVLSLILLSVLTLCVACSDGSCYDNGNSLPLVRFYMSDRGAVSVSGVSLRGLGAPGDSVLVTGETLSETYLPLRGTVSTTQWVIEVVTVGGPAVADTLSIDYKAVPYFAGAECGAMYSFDITGVKCTGNLIDSVVVKEPHVTNVNRESLRIYFKNQS